MPRPLDEVFAFFSDAANLESLTPPSLRFHILTVSTPHVQAGTLIRYRLSLHGIPFGWTTEIRAWNPPYSFTDAQLTGPFALWHHTHRFQSQAEGTLIEDIVRYRVPFGPIGRLINRMKVRGDVEEIFRYRRERIDDLFPKP